MRDRFVKKSRHFSNIGKDLTDELNGSIMLQHIQPAQKKIAWQTTTSRQGVSSQDEPKQTSVGAKSNKNSRNKYGLA